MIEREITLAGGYTHPYRFAPKVSAAGNWVLQSNGYVLDDETGDWVTGLWHDLETIYPVGFGTKGLRELAQLLEDTIQQAERENRREPRKRCPDSLTK